MVFMDTVAIPKGAPHLDLAYKMLEQCISAEGQKHIADTLTQAVITKAAVPLIDAKNREIYQYDNLASLFEKARFYPFWQAVEQLGAVVFFHQCSATVVEARTHRYGLPNVIGNLRRGERWLAISTPRSGWATWQFAASSPAPSRARSASRSPPRSSSGAWCR